MGDPTVGSRRDKKGSCPTRRDLRVGAGFEEFRQTPRGRVSPYLDFILCLRAMLMFELNEAVRGRLIGSKSWNRGVGFLKPMWTVRDCPRAVWSAMVKCVL